MKLRIGIPLFILAVLMTSCSAVKPDAVNNPTQQTTPSTLVTPTEIAPVWLSVPVNDALSGKTFTVNDLKGKVVLVEGMATWCPTCWAQSGELKSLKQKLNSGDGFVIISLALDSKEDAAALKDFAATGGFDWFFVTSSIDMYRDIGTRYGATYLDPTLVPLLIVDKQGKVQNFRKGKIPAVELENLIKPLLEAQS
jgi:cytochrome oxidase Cu insertion factor (SCO1/SenC/PrrC family)